MEISAEILKALNWRYAVKKFDATKKIASIAFGYRHQDDKYASLKKVRFSRDHVFTRV